MRPRLARPTCTAAVVVASLVLAPVPGASQQATLDEIEEMAAWGRAEEARTSLGTWWSDVGLDAARAERQRALWLRARLTVDPEQAALDLRRLVVEFPGGPFTDQALFRLALAAHTMGDETTANRHLGTLARDYPSSPIWAEAEAWFAGAAAPGPARLDRPVLAAEAQAVEPTPPPAQAARPAPTSTGRYAVQLGAFSSPERAEALKARADEAGLDARIVRVRGSQLLHVRVGVFDSSGDAGVFFRRVTERGFTAAVVRDVDREEPARE